MPAHSLIRQLALVVAITALLLCIPLIAMRFTPEVNWSIGDFMTAAALLLAAGTAIVLGVRRATTGRNKAIIVTVVIFLLLLVWAEFAVGVFS